MLKTLADRITAARFFLALVLFGILAWAERLAPSERSLPMWTAFALFVTAAVTDVVDGAVARRLGSSDFGRIADPFVDKVLVVGALVFLAAIPETRDLVPAWAVVVIVAREFLVTGIRGYVESRGLAFPADSWGKSKMVLQCMLVGGGILCLSGPADAGASPSIGDGGPVEGFLGLVPGITRVLLFLTLATTVFSAIGYLSRAWRFLSSTAAARP